VQLGITEQERDIRLSVTRNLCPAAQCVKVARTGNTILSQISRSFHFRDRLDFEQLYKQYVRPHLKFARTSWYMWILAGNSWEKSRK
jgi:hypothetical protein